jgi:hypothetical protein
MMTMNLTPATRLPVEIVKHPPPLYAVTLKYRFQIHQLPVTAPGHHRARQSGSANHPVRAWKKQRGAGKQYDQLMRMIRQPAVNGAGVEFRKEKNHIAISS